MQKQDKKLKHMNKSGSFGPHRWIYWVKTPKNPCKGCGPSHSRGSAHFAKLNFFHARTVPLIKKLYSAKNVRRSKRSTVSCRVNPKNPKCFPKSNVSAMTAAFVKKFYSWKNVPDTPGHPMANFQFSIF